MAAVRGSSRRLGCLFYFNHRDALVVQVEKNNLVPNTIRGVPCAEIKVSALLPIGCLFEQRDRLVGKVPVDASPPEARLPARRWLLRLVACEDLAQRNV